MSCRSYHWPSTTTLLLCLALTFATRAATADPRPEPSVSAVSAPPFDIGFIGLHGGVLQQLEVESKNLNLRVCYFEDGEIARRTADLGSVRVLYLQHIREEDRDSYAQLFQRALSVNPGIKVIAFAPGAAEFLRRLSPRVAPQQDLQAGRYYGSSRENLRRLLIYTAATYLGHDQKLEPPQEVDREGIYHPDHQELFPSAGAFQVWSRTRGTFADDKPRLMIAVHATHLTFQQPLVVDDLIREAERQGAVAAAIIDGRSKTYEEQIAAFDPHAVIHTCHSSDGVPLRRVLDVPHLHSIFIRKQSIDEWQQSLDGLSSSELAFHVIGQELIGGIEPQVAAGTKSGQGSAEAIQPIPDRVQHLIRRALSYARLSQTQVAQKKVAIVYYDREMGKGELMRGSATGMHLNGPRSLLNVLASMQHHGYSIRPIPRFEDELLGWMMARGRQIGVWAPAELDRLVAQGSPVLISAEQYRNWYEQKVPEDRRQQMDARWGPAPGRFMVWEDAGKKYIVIPRIDLGNVVLLPQPLRGEVHGKDGVGTQVHDKATTPPHNYLATYFWLEQQFGAHAVIHFGTHGSEFALPGKPNGLSQRDWCDVIMGRMPNFNPWIIENMVESSPVRRRVYGTLLSHLSPPIVDAGLSDELANLHESVDKWATLEEGALKEKFRDDITRQVRECRLDIDLKLTIPSDGKLDSASIEQVSTYLHDLQEETTPTSLHVYGERPRPDLLVPYMVNILRSPFQNALRRLIRGSDESNSSDFDHDVRPAAERILHQVMDQHRDEIDAVSAVLGRPITELPEEISKGLKLALKLNADFDHTSDEIDNLLAGLDGKFVPPGPGNNPIRNPGSIPTGRNMYLLNPEEVPTRPSWELGRKLAEELVVRHRAQTGTFPTKVGFDLRSSATFRDYGVMEAQILQLMGIEPIWDERQLVNDVRLIPREQLGRPRVDVFVAAGSWYESNLPSRLSLWDKAIRLATQADELDNPLFVNTLKLRETLVAKGLADDRAEQLAHGRIFGLAPGRETGSFLGYAVARSGDWNSRDEIAAEYLATHKHVYTQGAWGESAEPLYDAAIQGTHTVVRSWSDHMTSPLSSKYVWLHGGGLSIAVEAMTGKRPEYLFSDVRDPDRAALITAEDALRREFRVRLFNRRWVEGMMKEGYAGADHIRVMASNSFAWDVMRPGSVGNDNWNEMKQLLLDDQLNVRLREWMERNNPYAFQDATAVMLEAIRKGYWSADAETTHQVVVAYAESVSRHGLSGHITSGGNHLLDQRVRQEFEGATDPASQDLLAQYIRRIEEQTQVNQVNAGETATAPGPVPGVQSSVAAVAVAPMISGNAPGTSPKHDGNASEQAADASVKSEMVAPQGDFTAKPPTLNAIVEGQKLVQAEATSSSSASHSESAIDKRSRLDLWVAVASLGLIAVGFLTRRGAP